MESMIEDTDLKKHFGVTQALSRASVAASSGSIFGRPSPNGAGKSTAIRTVTTLILAKVDGKPGR